MRIQLSERFTYKKLLCFSLPTIAMMIFTSVYSIVDGFFAGKAEEISLLGIEDSGSWEYYDGSAGKRDFVK